MKDKIIIYYGDQCDRDCNCDYCVNRKKISESLQKFGHQVSIQSFRCDWNYYYPSRLYFDYAIRYHNKILGSLKSKTNEFPAKVIEFAKIHFDYIVCASKSLEEFWFRNGIESEYLLPPIKNSYSEKFKFQIAGDW